MDKVEQLLIRACKSNDPARRLLSVHRRFYGAYKNNNARNLVCIIGILAPIVDKYKPYPSCADVINEIARPTTIFDERDGLARALQMLIHRIKFTEHNKLPGLTSPLLFRIRKKERQDARDNQDS